MKSTLAIVVICLLLPGCRPLYEGFKAARTEECHRLFQPDQEECLRQAEVGYDEYERNRQEATRRQGQ
jgi:hypothetical protein